jgi:hypothetical protein
MINTGNTFSNHLEAQYNSFSQYNSNPRTFEDEEHKLKESTQMA